jgi:hypothetical protein
MKKTTLILAALLTWPGFASLAKAEQAFSNLGQPGGGFWGASESPEFGLSFRTGPGSFALDGLTLEQAYYSEQSAAGLRVRILQASAGGFAEVEALGNPQSLPDATSLPGFTTYVTFTPSAPVTLQANSEYLVAVSMVPGVAFQDFLATSSQDGFSSPVGWQLGSDWLGIMSGDEIWVPITFAGHLKAGVAATLLNQPPDVSHAVAKNAVLWPPSNNLVPVEIAGVTDPDGDAVQLIVTGIEQDEPVGSGGSAKKSPDAVIDSDGKAWVRAQRNGSGNGRVYKVHFAATDGKPNSVSSGVVYVTVPHDKGRGATAIDDGPVSGYFDSTQP